MVGKDTIGSAGVCIRSINEVSRIVGIPSSEVMCRSSGRCRSKVRPLFGVEDEVGNGTSSSLDETVVVEEEEEGLMLLPVAEEDGGADEDDVDGIGIAPTCCC